jgi:hypothetical protein
MALSRNARRRLNKNKAKARALRKLNRNEAIRLDTISKMVRKNTAAIKRGDIPDSENPRYWRGTTQNYSCGGSQSVSPQKHCEAKQRVTVHGKEQSLSGRQITKGKWGGKDLAAIRGPKA